MISLWTSRGRVRVGVYIRKLATKYLFAHRGISGKREMHQNTTPPNPICQRFVFFGTVHSSFALGTSSRFSKMSSCCKCHSGPCTTHFT